MNLKAVSGDELIATIPGIPNRMKGGIPVLAPGILTFGGVIGLAATYKHPSLEKSL